MDYNEFSEKIKAKYPQYKDIDNKELAEKMIAKYPQYQEQVSFEVKPQAEEPKGIDLTPSGLVKQGVASVVAPIRGAIHKEDYKTARENALKAAENFKPAGGAGDFLVDLAAYSQLPVLKGASIPSQIGAFAGNAAIQGGLPMALEGLKAGENPLGGFGGGTALGAGIQSLPYVGKVAKLLPQTGSLISRTVGRVKPETLQRAIQADSKALDLTEKEAQNLLMDTTERVQKDYQQLMDNAGLEVQKAALNLPEERGVFASSLKNALDDIYNGYSTSGIQELNPAFNNAGDIYNDITALIEAGTTGEKVSAKNLNDIMGNLKNYPIDWSKTSAKDRQSILKQIYSDYARRLGNLSPELRKANRAFSKLANFENNEGIRQILKPNKQGDLVNPSSVLRNYNSTVTKGNVNRNIQDLENLLVKEGKEPFINDIDDVNAAMDLLNIRGTGDSWLANLVTQGTRPALGLARAYNRSPIPVVIENAKNAISPLAERLLIPAISSGMGNMLYGGVSYDNYR